MTRPGRSRGPSLAPSVARATATTANVRPRRARDETITQILEHDGINIAMTATLPLLEPPPVIDGRPTIRDLTPPMSAGAYQITRKRGNTARASRPQPTVQAEGTAEHRRSVTASSPPPSDIRVLAEGGEVRLQLGEVTVRCSPATARWMAKALLTAASGA